MRSTTVSVVVCPFPLPERPPEGDADAVRDAAEFPMADFEGGFAVGLCLTFRTRHIVTRSTRNYKRSPIRAIDPDEVLAKLFQASARRDPDNPA